MTPSSFKANPNEWHQSTDLYQMLPLLQHLANDGNVTVALLAADFAERIVSYTGSSKRVIIRCVAAVRSWARIPTGSALSECIRAAEEAYTIYAYTEGDYSVAAYAAHSAARTVYFQSPESDAAYAAHSARVISGDIPKELEWQLDHVRKKHPLTEL